ncbi:MAG: TonB-dependent receptor [Gemmatimonadota bacterium]|nr:TonB-dependent receptor [Gemmatimonadota bacterium]
MSNRYCISGVIAALVLAFSVAGATNLAAQTGAVTGQVTDATTGQPLNDAAISLVDTDVTGLTATNGRYLLNNVPVGVYTVKVVILGYATQEKEVTVTPGSTQQVDFQLEISAINLDEIVATGVAGQVERRKVGVSLPSVKVDELTETMPVDNFSQVLEGRIPGVRSIGTNGSIGGGRQLRIRGIDTFGYTSVRPVVYIDGVRVDTRKYEWGYMGTTCCGFSGGAGEDRLGDLNPEEIDRIEILKGPAAATLFGSEAAAGVIQVFTKRGRSNTPSTFTLNSSVGMNRLRANLPTKLRPTLQGPDGFVPWDPNETLIENGLVNTYDLSASGGGEDVTYFVSTGLSYEEGSIKPNDATRGNIRVNLNWTASENLSLGLTSGYVRNKIFALQTGNNWLGIYTNAMLSNPFNATAEEPYGGGLDVNVENSQAIRTFSDADRWTGSVTLNYTPMPNFSHRFTFGLDAVTDQKTRHLPWGRYYTYLGERGEKNIGYRSARKFTSDFLSSYDYDNLFGMDFLTGSISFGGQGYWDVASLSMAIGRGYAASGVTTVSGSSERQANESFSEEINLGFFLQNRFDLSDDLFVTTAVRADGNSAFGDNYGFQIYPKADVAYNIPQTVLPEMVSSLKFRAAVGMAGKAPGAFAKFQTFFPVTVLEDKPGVTPSGPGNQDIEPENKREVETGLDIGLFNNRVGMELTYYDARTINALFYLPKAPSTGTYGRTENCCVWLNRGFEAAATGSVIESASFRWNMNLTYEWNFNRLHDLGDAAVDDSVGMYTRDPETGFWTFSHWRYTRQLSGWFEGESIANLWGFEIESWDPEARTHIRTERPFNIGLRFPTHMGSINNTFQIKNDLVVRFQFRGETGHHMQNADRAYGIRQYGYDELLVEADPRDGTLTAAGDSILDYHRKVWALDSREHIRLQELSLAYTVPESVSGRLGLQRTTVMLSGYNLHWWDHCNCQDPNASYSASDFDGFPFLSPSQPRKFQLSVRTRF